MDFSRREELRATFDAVAPLYHRARPAYPEPLFSDALEITRLAPPARLLEIGTGTGIATRVLAERGFEIVGVELDESMARVARDNLARWDAVEVVSDDFEKHVPGGTFDAVVAFSAFHWIDPLVRYAKAASALRDGGFLIVADARMVVDEAVDPFFTEVEADYEAVLGERAHAPGAPGLRSLDDEMSESGVFTHVAHRRYRWDVNHTAETYVDLLDTFPWHRSLAPQLRGELYARIRKRIDQRHAGTLTATFEAVLDVGRVDSG